MRVFVEEFRAERSPIRIVWVEADDIHGRIAFLAFQALDVAGSVKSRKSYGGTAPANVLAAAKRWIKRLEKEGLSRKKG